jgi:hypothetical protein
MSEKPKKNLAEIKEQDLFEEGFDGCYFRQMEEPESTWVDFSFLRFQEAQEFEISPDTDFVNWIILLFEKHPDVEEMRTVLYYEAYLGDALHFVKNQAMVGSEGLVIKKCLNGYKVASNIMSKFSTGQSVKDRIDTDLLTYKTEHNLA